MRCEKIRRQLPDYSVGGLRRRRRLLIQRHAEQCAPCRAELAALTRTGALLSEVAPESAPEGVWEAIYRGLAAQKARRVRGRPRLRLALAGAVGLLLLVAGGLSLRSISSPPVLRVERVATMDRDSRAAEEGHLSAAWSAPLADTAAVGLGLEADEDDS